MLVAVTAACMGLRPTKDPREMINEKIIAFGNFTARE